MAHVLTKCQHLISGSLHPASTRAICSRLTLSMGLKNHTYLLPILPSAQIPVILSRAHFLALASNCAQARGGHPRDPFKRHGAWRGRLRLVVSLRNGDYHERSRCMMHVSVWTKWTTKAELFPFHFPYTGYGWLGSTATRSVIAGSNRS